MEDKTIDFYSFEEITSRMERTNVRLWIMCIILIFLLVGSNGAWLYYEKSFEDVTTTVTQELDAGDGGNAVINDGVHINGESKTVDNN